MRLRRAGRLTAVFVLVLAGCGGHAALRRPATPPPHPPSSVQRLLTAAETLRGLRFRYPVQVAVVSRTQLAQLLAGLTRSDASLGAGPDDLLHLLGVLSPATGLRSLYLSSLDAGVAGLYDPKTKHLYVVDPRGGAVPPSVVVHEATHALQDQWFDLRDPTRFLRPTDADAALAATALIEGDAMTTQGRFLAAEGPLGLLSEGVTSLGELGSGSPHLPAFLSAEQLFPYEAGQRFVAALIAHGGMAAANAAFRHPPHTTAAVLDPSRYFAGDPGPVRITPPPVPAGAKRLVSTTFGAEDVAALTGSDAAAHSWLGGWIIVDSRQDSERLVLEIACRDHGICARALAAALPARVVIATLHGRIVVTINGCHAPNGEALILGSAAASVRCVLLH